jgi:hypothetical protein
MRAVKATVTIGHLTIDGYRTEGGMFGMSLSDICRIIGWDVKRGSHIFKNKWVKELAVKGFEGSERVTLPEKNHAVIVSIEWVPSILQCLARSGNDGAWETLSVFAGLSLQKLFCDAFGEKFETEEMQAWLQARYGSIEKRNAWTDAIKAYGETHDVSETWKRFVYSHVSDRLNIALTGHKTAYWIELFDCSRSTLRDQWTYRHLSNIDSIEKHATVLVQRGSDPLGALDEALEFFAYPVNPEPRRTVSAGAEYKQRRRAAGKAN